MSRAPQRKARYAELQAVTNLSFLEGGSHPHELVVRAAELGLGAIAITDRNSLAGIVRAHLAARELRSSSAKRDSAANELRSSSAERDSAAKELDVKLIVGCRLTFMDGSPDLLCYPQDRAAYGRLCRLLTVGKSDRVFKQQREAPPHSVSLPEGREDARTVLHLVERTTSPSPLGERTAAPSPSPLGERVGVRGSSSKDEIPKGECHLTFEDFLAFSEGQIAALIPPDDVFQSEENARAFGAHLAHLAAHLEGRVYLAASCRFQGGDAKRLHRLAGVAKAARVPLLATNDVLYHDPARRRLQDVLTCIRHTCTIGVAGFRLARNAERHLKSPEEMARLFAAYPEAIANTIELASRCNFNLQELTYEYPDEIAPNGEAPQARLERLTWEGLKRRYPAGTPASVVKQIEHEFELIARLKYAPFFLTVEDIVRFARKQGILHQGRGSAANSAVCYALGITEVDPARSNLLFERFISDARDEPPDIDVDFEHERREEVIQYVYNRFGRHRAGLCATIICYRTRGAVREVGKALGLSPDITAALAGSVSSWSEDTIGAGELRELGLDPRDRRLALCIELTRELTGFPRHLSQHPGGFLIARGRLDELVPIENASMEDRTVISWDKDDIEALGMLKVDVLALGMLTCLAKGFALLRQHYGVDLSPATVPAEDQGVYEMLSRADSIGVFQVESRAQQTMLPRLKPRCFYDLVIEVAIVRPGPIQGDMVHPYLRRRQGLEKPRYPSEELKKILEKTLGVPLFQEQCMQIAIVAAGFQPARADELRRAMATFKKIGTIHTFKDEFIRGMLAKNYERDFAERCFSQIQGFGTYGFPESHAASFALLVYCSAWLKRYYPDVFAAAILNSQPMGFYAPAQLVRDAAVHGVEVRPIDVNASEWDHTLEPVAKAPSPCPSPHWGEGTTSQRLRADSLSPWGEGQGEGGLPPGNRHALRLGLRLIAGFGEEDANRLVAARRQGGPFLTPEDLMRRAKLPPAAMRTLARADAFGSLDLGRRETLWHVAGLEADNLPLLPSPQPSPPGRGSRACTLQQRPLSHGERDRVRGEPQLPPLRDEESVTEDYSAFGLSLRNHPMAFMRNTLRAKGMATAADLKNLPDGRYVKIAGLVLFRQRPGTAKGTIFVTIEDETGAANLIVWPKTAAQYRRAVFGAKVLLCEGVLQKESNVIHVVSRHLTDWTPLLKNLQPGQSDAMHLQLDRDGQVFHNSSTSFRARKSVHTGWTNSLKSRDFR
jgi:error-prone DNA polymerase